MKSLEKNLMRILNESKLISLFDYEYIKEGETNIEGELAYKYFVNMRDDIKNPFHISSFEFYNRKYPYKDGSFSKFRVYHGGKMPKEIHNKLENLNYVISKCKSYIDFASDDIDNFISVAREIYSILN